MFSCIVSAGANAVHSFFCEVKMLRLDSCGKATLEICFLPLTMGRHQCTVIFTDEVVGEFLYLIIGSAVMPLPEPVAPLSCAVSAAQTCSSGQKESMIYPCIVVCADISSCLYESQGNVAEYLYGTSSEISQKCSCCN